MKILFVSPSYKPAYIYGGPAVSVSQLAEALTEAGHQVTVYTTTANGKEELNVQRNLPVIVNGVTVYYFKRQTGDHTHVSLALWNKLWRSASSFETINLQSWWSVLMFGAATVCWMKRCKYILSPRGMLSSYSFNTQHTLSKKLLHKAVGKKLLRYSYLHATTGLEWNDCLLINKGWEGFILPNLFLFPEFSGIDRRIITAEDKITLGFLSRIDQKKGLELLIRALSNVHFDFSLKIAGVGTEEYIASLKELSLNQGIAHRIEWCGWKKDGEKFDFLQSVDVFVLTSYNENFANSVTEALSVGTPVFLSTGVGLADYVTENRLGWVCETNVASITQKLIELSSQRLELNNISKRAPGCVKRDFDQKKLAGNYVAAYQQFY